MPGVTIQEPPVNPEDTAPNAAQARLAGRSARPNRVAQFGVLGMALAITVVAGILYTEPIPAPIQTPPPPTVIILTAAVTPTGIPPTDVPTESASQGPQLPAPDVLAALLVQPADSAPPSTGMFHHDTVFTIAPPGPRAKMSQYKVQPGDTLENIASRFNLSTNTLLWNNDIHYVNLLSTGTLLNIPPIDGIYYTPTSDQTLQQIADQFKVSAYAIINSEYNRLQDAEPGFLVPANALRIFVPGGVTKVVSAYWNPVINVRAVSACGNSCGSQLGKTGTIEFGGGAGSCGYQTNGGGNGNLAKPLSGYVVVRGFSNVHSGIDLAKPPGSPVFAAGAGTIIFAGWSDWGYGNSIVIAHTPNLMTLYGHLSQINVGCGQFVGQGQLIGAVGSTGNSTGPHLHFEIRINQVPVDPRSVMGF